MKRDGVASMAIQRSVNKLNGPNRKYGVAQTILLLGNNTLTAEIAGHVMETGLKLILATPGGDLNVPIPLAADTESQKHVEVLTKTSVTACHGTCGDFTIQMVADGRSVSRKVSQVIISEDVEKETDFTSHGLYPSPGVVSLSRLRRALDSDAGTVQLPAVAAKVVFLIGLLKEATSKTTRDAMESALNLQQSGNQVYILTGNLKVADFGLERLYRYLKEAGTVFIKFTKTRPKIFSGHHDQVIIEFDDEVAGRPFRLSPDLTVLDEITTPSQYLEKLVQIFELERDLNGFAQADNIHRLGVLTNRKGILVAGPARNALTVHEQFSDGRTAVLTTVAAEHREAAAGPAPAEIDPGRCIRCLTCHRLCPYRAIVVNTRVQIQPSAC